MSIPVGLFRPGQDPDVARHRAAPVLYARKSTGPPHKAEADRNWRLSMSKGTVKWFNDRKGYGFIQPDDGSRDVFVHKSAVERASLGTLNEGQSINYDVEPGQ